MGYTSQSDAIRLTVKYEMSILIRRSCMLIKETSLQLTPKKKKLATKGNQIHPNN